MVTFTEEILNRKLFCAVDIWERVDSHGRERERRKHGIEHRAITETKTFLLQQRARGVYEFLLILFSNMFLWKTLSSFEKL